MNNNNNNSFNNLMKFLTWMECIVGIFFMYKCLTYPKISLWLVLIAGVTIVSIIISSGILLTDSLNQFYYDIASLDQSVKSLDKTMQSKSKG